MPKRTLEDPALPVKPLDGCNPSDPYGFFRDWVCEEVLKLVDQDRCGSIAEALTLIADNDSNPPEVRDMCRADLAELAREVLSGCEQDDERTILRSKRGC